MHGGVPVAAHLPLASIAHHKHAADSNTILRENGLTAHGIPPITRTQ
jgi:hypothetical protein